MLIRVKEVDILLHMLFISVSLRLVYMLLVDILAKVYELYVLIFLHPAKKRMFVLFDFLVCLATDHSNQYADDSTCSTPCTLDCRHNYIQEQ